MHICFTVSAMNTGGAERVVSTLCNELSSRGHHVSIVMASVNKKESFYDLANQIELFALCEGYAKKVSPFKRVELLRKKYEELKPDIVISFLPHICVYTWLSLRNGNIPYILSERNDPNQYSVLYKALIKKAFKAAHGCVFQTHDAIKWYRKNAKGTDRVIFNAVGLTSVPPVGMLIKRKKSVLFVGRIDEQKNYKMLLEAYKLFLEYNDEYVLDIYGDCPQEKIFFEYARKLGVEDKIHHHGKSSTWHKDEYNAGLFVSTSNYEGMSNSLQEAAALGIPCVATDCPIGGSKELSGIFDNIILSPVNDPKNFCRNMRSMVTDKTVFKGVNALVTKENITDKWIELIDVVMEKYKK